MSSSQNDDGSTAADLPAPGEEKPLSPAAQRALAEAEERRRKAAEARPEKEIGGQNGPDPVRYGDWEKAGIVSDF